ncbi:YqjD family protein [Pantoea sp. Aalb]|uniref:DUF883 family protein n=1 Tax=Pantoea sp. Aalb TaxID=2576762 RepID=UPI00132A7717|nr:DUF883 family protein [Pantoea sp. Aalb]MXP67697.1 DUF883 family protein [Pantoea sp. Aalb]
MVKQTSFEHLRTELKNITNNLEEVISSSADKSKFEVNKLRNKAKHVLDSSLDRIDQSSAYIAKTTRETIKKADNYLHKNPWQGTGMGIVIGFILGILIIRR